MEHAGDKRRHSPTAFTRRLDSDAFRLLVESTTDYAIFLLDPEGCVASWNAGAERINGYGAAEIIGRHFSIFYPPDAVERDWPAQELALATRDGRFEDEGWRIRKDGRRFWANVVITALRDSEGRLLGFGKVSRDLSERRRADQQLRESEERFRLIVESTIDYAIFMLDPTGRVASWNAGAERIKGYRADEIIGRHFSTFYTQDAIDRGWPDHELAEATRVGRFEDEGWRVRSDGTQFWANVVITALRGADGTLRGFAKVTRDLTLRKRHEERIAKLTSRLQAQVIDLNTTNRELSQRNAETLVESELRLASIIGTTMDAIVMCDESLQIVLFNRSAEEMFLCEASAAVSRTLRDFIPGLDVSVGSGGEAASRGATLQRRVEVEGVATNGAKMPIEVSISDVVVHGRRLFTVIARDISERRRVEAELREADRRKDIFLGMLAHELRNPLAAISTAGEVLHRMTDQPAGQKLTGVIRRQTLALARMVDDLLDVSRVTLGKIQLAREPILVGDVVERAVDGVRDAASRAQLLLDVVPGPEPVWVLGDATRIEQVLVNLLTNAIKFTPADGRITVEVGIEGRSAVIRVRDTGVGIDPELLPKIFELFVQGDTSLDRTKSGLGIGLALVRQVVSMHGGQVTAESPGPGLGSAFVVRLPAASNDTVTKPDARAFEPHTDGRLRVIVVDDQPDLADCVAMLIETMGHSAQAAYGGPEALEAGVADTPDLMLVDIGMPGMTGYDLARAIRREPRLSGVKLVALTGYGREEDRARVAAAGFDLHLTKPVDDQRLRDLLDQVAADARSDP